MHKTFDKNDYKPEKNQLKFAFIYLKHLYRIMTIDQEKSTVRYTEWCKGNSLKRLTY
jgi:hypothetical protein